ncbi:MAG: hypothetical protein WAV47_17735, partial [Blastocatellia bacterium]
MKMTRAGAIAVLIVAVAALALPVTVLRARAASSTADVRGRVTATKAAAITKSAVAVQQQGEVVHDSQESIDGRISSETLKALGISKAKGKDASARIANALKKSKGGNGDVSIQSGQPLVLNARSALSAALLTNIGGRDNQFSEVALIADWDGREDCVADREQKVDDFSFSEVEPDVSLTRNAISEHTVANGFAENVYYYGDTVGNFWVGTDVNPGLGSSTAAIDALRQVNIPALLNSGASGGFTITGIGCTDDQVTITGIAVQPVADLGDFGLATCGTIGEVVYVSILDTEGCSSNASNQPLRTRIFAFAFTDGVGAGAMTPAGVIQVFSSQLSNFAGVAVDDDGSLYFQLLDVIQFSGGAIFKAAPIPHVPVTGCSLRSTRVVPSIPTASSINSAQGTTANPILSSSSARLTNYSGPSTLWGDIIAIATGPCNVLYAAVSASFVAGAVSFEQLTQGLFPAPSALGPTPSMVISFADCSGAFDVCSSPAPGVPGTLPVANGFADAAANGLTVSPGVNNFRVFVQGNGPAIPATNPVVGLATGATPLKVDMQIDYVPGHSGLAVNEEGTVFVISGGSPAGIGKNPSPMVGEILCFEDICPSDRRADFVDLRGDAFPNPPASGGNTGDGDSDRFDHIFYQAPLDVNTATPAGLAGLSRGFLRYFWRLAPSPIGPGVTLGVTSTRQTNDDSDGPIVFESFDPGHQVAGGDDQNTPFRGDDDNGLGSPVLVGALSGGFEFVFGGPVGTAACVWNGFFLNSNGNITFGLGDTSPFPTVPAFRSG